MNSFKELRPLLESLERAVSSCARRSYDFSYWKERELTAL